MSVLAAVDAAVSELERGGALEAALAAWRRRHPCLGPYGCATQLARELLDPAAPYAVKDEVAGALCREAAGGDEAAGLVVVWLFLPALRRLCRGGGDELEAEAVLGLWEAVGTAAGVPPAPVCLCLARGARRRAQAQRRMQRRRSVEEPAEVVPAPPPRRGSPGELIAAAVGAGVISAVAGELIEATRLGGEALAAAAEALRIPLATASRLRRRAEGALCAWYGVGPPTHPGDPRDLWPHPGTPSKIFSRPVKETPPPAYFSGRGTFSPGDPRRPAKTSTGPPEGAAPRASRSSSDHAADRPERRQTCTT